MTTMTTTQTVAQRLARHVSELRNAPREVHLTEPELCALFEVVAELTLSVRPIPKMVAELVKDDGPKNKEGGP